MKRLLRAKAKCTEETTRAFQYFRVPGRAEEILLAFGVSAAPVMQVTIGACRCCRRAPREIPIMEWIERLSLSSGFRFPFILRFARGTLRAATESCRKIARHLPDKDQQLCVLNPSATCVGRYSPGPCGARCNFAADQTQSSTAEMIVKSRYYTLKKHDIYKNIKLSDLCRYYNTNSSALKPLIAVSLFSELYPFHAR